VRKRLRLSVLIAIGLLIVAAIVIPSWLRSRMQGGEAPAIGDARSVLSAEEVYASSNGGFYDELGCLAAPASCIPGYPTNGPPFLDLDLASLRTRSGYVRRFHPGPKPSAEEIATAKASPSSLRGFAYVLVPTKSGETGVRAFCIDHTGVICYTPDGAMPDITDGRCPPSVQSIQEGRGQETRPPGCVLLQ